MPSIIWSAHARSDISRLHSFLAIKSRLAADKAISAIVAGIKLLAHQPEIGRFFDDTESYIREWLIEFGHDGYAVLYRIENDDVVILAIRHQKEAGY